MTSRYRPIRKSQVLRLYLRYPNGMPMVHLRKVDDILCFHILAFVIIIVTSRFLAKSTLIPTMVCRPSPTVPSIHSHQRISETRQSGCQRDSRYHNPSFVSRGYPYRRTVSRLGQRTAPCLTPDAKFGASNGAPVGAAPTISSFVA